MKFWGRHWWRVALMVVALAVSTYPWTTFPLAWLGFVPVAVWCGALAASSRAGIGVGVALLVVLAWFVVPRELGTPGRWVPSELELLWLYPICAAVICGVGLFAQRRGPAGTGLLLAMVLGGLFITGCVLFLRLEAPPEDESVVPLPSTLQLAQQEVDCGSGGCSRMLNVSGWDAYGVMHGHLTEKGYTSKRTTLDGRERLCRVNGLVVPHTSCAELRAQSDGSVQVIWYVA
jgi:hypothetical protein